MKKRVVITGLGIISVIGQNVEEFWENCINGCTNVAKIPEKWLKYSNYNSKIWSALPQITYTANDGLNRIEQKQLDPSSLMVIKASFEAINNAGFNYELHDKKRNTYKISEIDSNKTGIFIGTGIGGVSTLGACYTNHTLAKNHSALLDIISKLEQGNGNCKEEITGLKNIAESMIYPKRFNPFAVSMIMANACSANIGIKFCINGRNNTFSSACASGTVAIGNAYRSIANGENYTAITGGTEYMHDEYGALFYAFDIIKALAVCSGDDINTVNRPFDINRSGFLYSQGGCSVLILEELEHALKRGANIYAEITGYNENCDAHNIMMIENTGTNIKRLIVDLLNDTGTSPGNIDYINTHGTGTVLNDEVESKVIEEIFGKKPFINSTKSLVGHSLGASGAIECLVTALSIKKKTSHTCKNLENPIRELNFITEVKELPIKNALTQSFGFGGHNSALLLKEYKN